MTRTSADRPRQFASDNCAGVCPAVMAALAEANHDHAPAYGEDAWTQRAIARVRELFEADCEVFFVFNGTAANALSLAAMCAPFNSVICHADAHIQTDECGAPGLFTPGLQLCLIEAPHGKLTPALIEAAATRRDDVHAHRPRAVSITESTEFGTVYSVDQVAAVAECARRHGLLVHMDGARFANAVAALGVRPRALTVDAGVDVLSFGGTKNGMMAGEAVVFFNRQLAGEFGRRRKQAGQLASKMRFLAAQWLGMLDGDLWLHNARHANAMAQRLARHLSTISAARLVYPVEANAVFVELPVSLRGQLEQRGWHFYTDVGPSGAARLMCAWDTPEEDVDALVADLVADIEASSRQA